MLRHDSAPPGCSISLTTAAIRDGERRLRVAHHRTWSDGIEERTFGHRAVLLCFLPCGHDFSAQRVPVQAAACLCVRPVALGDQVLLQSFDRVAEWKRRATHLWVDTWSGRHSSSARRRDRSPVLDQRWATAAPCAFSGPQRDRIDRQQVVAVNADAGNTQDPDRALRTVGARHRPNPWNVEIAH